MYTCCIAAGCRRFIRPKNERVEREKVLKSCESAVNVLEITISALRFSHGTGREVARRMYSVLVVDNQHESLAQVVQALEASTFAGQLSISTCNGEEGIRQYLDEVGDPDIVFISIELGEDSDNGIELVQRFFDDGVDALNASRIVYIANSADYCTAVYRTEHVSYLVRPYRDEDFAFALSRAIDHVEAYRSEPLGVKVNGNLIRLEPRNIKYIESRRRKVYIATTEGSVELYASLRDSLPLLPREFCQCHKSFVVNFAHAVRLNNEGLHLKSGDIVPVSQARRKEVHAQFVQRISNFS